MSIPQSGGGPITDMGQLAAYMQAGCKPAADWRIGTEHEKFGYLKDSLLPLPYDGPASVRAMLEGLRDAAALAEVIVDARRLGLDPGATGVLERYESWRRFDNALLATSMDAMNRLFSNDIAPLKFARRAGLDLVDAITPLKQFFMRQAGGEAGEVPRLMRGDAM